MVDTVILPLRHTVFSVNLWALKIAFPGAWDAEEFWQGVPEAFRQVTPHLDLEDRDVRPLLGLVSEELVAELLAGATARRDVGTLQARFRSVLDVKMRGIFTATAKSDENDQAAVWVTVLLRSTEEYEVASALPPGDVRQSFRVKRSHKWTFKRVLPGDEGDEPPGDWQLVTIDKKRWVPPENLKFPER